MIFFFILSFLLITSISLFLNHKLAIRKLFELIIISISLYIVELGIIGFILMIFKKFDLFNINSIQLSILLLILYFIWKYKCYKYDLEIPGISLSFSKVFKSVLVIFAVYLYMFFPTYSFTGGWDAGLYINFGVHIAETGNLDLSDPQLEELHGVLQNTLRVEYPGIYSAYLRGLSDSTGDLIPQFFHLLSVYLAISYSLFGLDGLVRFNGIVGLLALSLIYLFSKNYLKKYWALVFVVLYVANAAQLWSVRSTLTETLSQFLIFLSLYLLILAYKRKSNIIGLFSGLILGVICLNRIDSLLFIVILSVHLIYTAFFTRKYLALSLNYFFGFFLFALLGMIYGYFYSYPYLYDLWTLTTSLKKLILISVVSLILVILFLLLKYFLKKKYYEQTIKLVLFRKGKYISITLGIGLSILLLYAYFIRPTFRTGFPVNSYEYFKNSSIIAFSWYVPMVFLVFAVVGLSVSFKEKSFYKYSVFMLSGLFYLIGYLYEPSISPPHPYASRRWLMIAIPFAIIVALKGVKFLLGYFKKPIQIIFASLLIGFFIIYSFNNIKFFINKSMLKGYQEQYLSISGKIPEDSIVFTNNNQMAGPLKYLFNRSTYLLNSIDANTGNELSNFLNKTQKNIYLLSSNYFVDGISYEYIDTFELKGPWMEAYGKYPRQRGVLKYSEDLYRIYYNKSYVSYSWKPVAPAFKSQVGKKINNSLISNGNEGFLLHGPYIALSNGKYEIEFKGEILEGDLNGFVDVVINKGKDTIKKVPLSSTKHINKSAFSIKTVFNLNENVKDAEFRLFLKKDGTVKLNHIILKKKL